MNREDLPSNLRRNKLIKSVNMRWSAIQKKLDQLNSVCGSEYLIIHINPMGLIEIRYTDAYDHITNTTSYQKFRIEIDKVKDNVLKSTQKILTGNKKPPKNRQIHSNSQHVLTNPFEKEDGSGSDEELEERVVKSKGKKGKSKNKNKGKGKKKGAKPREEEEEEDEDEQEEEENENEDEGEVEEAVNGKDEKSEEDTIKKRKSNSIAVNKSHKNKKPRSEDDEEEEFHTLSPPPPSITTTTTPKSTSHNKRVIYDDDDGGDMGANKRSEDEDNYSPLATPIPVIPNENEDEDGVIEFQ